MGYNSFNCNLEFNILFAERNETQASAYIKAFEDTLLQDQPSALVSHEVVENGSEKSTGEKSGLSNITRFKLIF